MSYILDALQQSERDRRRGKVPDLASVHVTPILREDRWSGSSWVLAVVLLGNVIFAGLWLYEVILERTGGERQSVLAATDSIEAIPSADWPHLDASSVRGVSVRGVSVRGVSLPPPVSQLGTPDITPDIIPTHNDASVDGGEPVDQAVVAHAQVDRAVEPSVEQGFKTEGFKTDADSTVFVVGEDTTVTLQAGETLITPGNSQQTYSETSGLTLFSPNQVSPNQVAGRTDGDSVKNSVKNSANNREGTKKADSKKDRVASSTTTYADSDATPEEQRDVLPPLDPENDPYAGLFDRPASYRHPSLPGELSYEYAPSVPKTPVDEQTIADYESAGHEVIVPGGSRGEGSRGNTHPEAPLPSSELALRSTLSPAISDMPAKPDMREVPNRIEGGRVESEVESSGRRVSWDTVPLQSQLPAVVLVEFPELHYSSHIYSSDPRFRSVTINERVFRERDQVEPRVRVVEITEQGVIMQFDEVRFKVALLDQWLE